MGRKIDIAGKRFGRLTAIEKAEDYRYPNGEHAEKWRCVCDCGNTVVVFRKCLLSGNTASCGCTRGEKRITHGGKGTKLYDVWCGMKGRCNNRNNDDYERYGGRGISVCNEWNDDFASFRDWALSNGYADGLTIDRINVDGSYCPDNCRWVGVAEQANNRTNNVHMTYNGETHTCAEWSKITGINYYTLIRRYKSGMPIEDVFSHGKLKTGPKSI